MLVRHMTFRIWFGIENPILDNFLLEKIIELKKIRQQSRNVNLLEDFALRYGSSLHRILVIKV